MKLYTEEQVREAMKEARYSFSTDKSYDKILESITPIELPSDEEIENQSEYFEYTDGIYGFTQCAKWMKGQIQKKIQKQLLSDIMKADEKDGLYENK